MILSQQIQRAYEVFTVMNEALKVLSGHYKTSPSPETAKAYFQQLEAVDEHQERIVGLLELSIGKR